MNDTFLYSLSPEQRSASLFNELRLKIVRQVVSGMKSRRIWLSSEKFEQIIRSRKELGVGLRNKFLYPVLGENDCNVFDSAAMFGFDNYGFATRVPLALAFGSDMGSGFYQLLAPQGHKGREVSGLCAVFNFGISIFDRVCDYYRTNDRLFANIFDEQILNDLFDDREGYVKLAVKADDILIPELRILVKVICAFFSMLHQLTGGNYRTEEWMKLKIMMIGAYHSQMASVAPGKHTGVNLLELSEKKSTLPFRIMFQIVRVCEQVTPETAQGFDEIRRAIAQVFWEIDDLADLSSDIQTGDVNSVLIRAENAQLIPGTKNMLGLAQLLMNGKETEVAVDSFCENLHCLLNALNTDPILTIDEIAFRELIVAYVRTWLPKIYQ